MANTNDILLGLSGAGLEALREKLAGPESAALEHLFGPKKSMRCGS